MSARCAQCRAPITEPARCSRGHAQPTSAAEVLATAVREMREEIAGLRAEVAGLRRERVSAPDEMVDVKEKARLLGVSTDTIYAHADDFGAIRIGTGPKAHLRFPRECLRQAGGERTEPEPTAITESRRPSAGAVPLLAVRGEAA